MIDVRALCEKGIEEWEHTSCCKDFSMWQYTTVQQESNEQRFDAFLQDILPYFNAFPKGKRAQAKWKKQGQAYMESLMNKEDLVLIGEMDEQSRILFQDITISFLQDVRRFDQTLSIEDAMQALRNVWIIAILQRIFQKDVGYHQAMFAYSMLYPYSDNYLDDPTISLGEKASFNTWFTKRLEGSVIQGRNDQEEKISALVQMIEATFPRSTYPLVYESLYMIQKAQVLSLHQQDGTASLTKEELTHISFQKGGASVVADGFLIDGELNEEQLMFCMRYGFMLQLGDDLQDGVSDALNNHQTLISTTHSSLDDLVSKLIQYTVDILQPSCVCQDSSLLSFVCKDCLFLLFLAVAQGEVCIAQDLKQTLLTCLPIRQAYLKQKQAAGFTKLSDKELWERIDLLITS